MTTLKREYIICHAPCYPDPYRPWPQTLENAQSVQRDVGGEIKTRLVSEWEAPAVLTAETPAGRLTT